MTHHRISIGCEAGHWEPAALFFRAHCTCYWASNRFAERDNALEAAAKHRRRMQVEEGR